MLDVVTFVLAGLAILLVAEAIRWAVRTHDRMRRDAS